MTGTPAPADPARADGPPSPAGARVSSILLDGRGRVLAADEPDRPYYAASTIKLHVLLAALRAADRGALDLDATLPATRTFTGADVTRFTLAGDHLDPTHPGEGDPIAVRELLVRMIDRSSNEATNAVLALVGLDAVADVIAELGLRGTRVERAIGDPAAVAAGLTNETTARDLAVTLHALASGAAVSPGATRSALAALRAQRIRVIATVLRPGVDAGSKSGEVDGFRHDVAFVGDPAGDGVRYLAVLTAGLPLAAADAEIRRRARELLGEAAA